MLNGSLYKNRFLDIVGSLNIDSFLVRQGLLSSSGVLQGYGSLSNFGFLFQFDSLYLFGFLLNSGPLLVFGFLPLSCPLKYSVLIYACGLYCPSFLLLNHQECPVYVKSFLECAEADIALPFRIDVLLPPHAPGLLLVMLHLAFKKPFI